LDLEFGIYLGFGDWDFVSMLPKELIDTLQAQISRVDHPRELAVDVMLTLQRYYGYLSDEALVEGAQLLGMTPLELEELATFYDFIYRESVGKYVIHICDSVTCWINGYPTMVDYLCRKLGIGLGETTPDGMFTILPTACIGYCDLSPAMLVNGRPYGPLTFERIDEILQSLREKTPPSKLVR
jgi:NADH-quinone oxidoreductase subunit E